MKLPKFKDYVGQPVKYIQRKMDGHMYHIIKHKTGDIFCVTKNGKDKTDKILAVGHIKEQLRSIPCDTYLMVELHCPGELATTVAHMIAHGDQRLEIAVFAAPVLGGLDLYYEHLDVVMDVVAEYGLDVVKAKLLTESHYTGAYPLTSKRTQSLLHKAEKQKIEGWVLKQSHMEGWYKLKPVKTIDAFVVSVTESDSETYAGHMKAVKLGLNDNISLAETTIHDLGECGGGFTKVFKKSMTYEQACAKLIGKVCEVAYQSITTHKKLQFPRFIRWRDDKDKEQCTTEQLT